MRLPPGGQYVPRAKKDNLCLFVHLRSRQRRLRRAMGPVHVAVARCGLGPTLQTLDRTAHRVEPFSWTVRFLVGGRLSLGSSVSEIPRRATCRPALGPRHGNVCRRARAIRVRFGRTAPCGVGGTTAADRSGRGHRLWNPTARWACSKPRRFRSTRRGIGVSWRPGGTSRAPLARVAFSRASVRTTTVSGPTGPTSRAATPSCR